MNSIAMTNSPRVIFASGALSQVVNEIAHLNKKRILLISDESAATHATRLQTELGALVIHWVNHVVVHVPDDFSSPIADLVRREEIDLVLTIGGGSATGLGKIIALDCSIDLLAIPTTYAGSEMTSIWGRTHSNEKTTGRNPAVLPKTTIYDPELTLSLPYLVSVNSGMNAIAHAVEALYSPEVTSEIKAAALDGIRIFAAGLRGIRENINNLNARTDLLRGSMLCGFALNNSTMGIHHKICHTLGGMFDLPHAPMHSAVLPWAVQYNQDFATTQLNEVAEVLSARSAAEGLWDLANEVGAQTSLQELGYPLEKSEEVATVISSAKYVNPRPFNHDGILELLSNAYKGSRPDDES